ncbi:MAG: polysaccharide deacetylase family protein [Oscillospiraceae bacterium]|nr:polysaccharide deacetylase family protein [Oscillospiraceae bacterium]
MTRKRLALLCSAFLVAIAAAICSYDVLVSKASEEKKLPIYSVEREEKLISLSFDAAWGNEQTQSLLDTLKEFEVKSTFFLVGMWVDKYPESVKAIAQAGHDIGNHSDTHPHMTKIDDEKMVKQIEDCNEKIQKITGIRPTLFRAPYGDYNNKLVETVSKLGMFCIQWNIDSLDWKGLDEKNMIKKFEKKIKPGSIALLHNGGKHTPEALPGIIKFIKSKDYKIVPISEIIYKDNFTIEHDGQQSLN